MTLVLVVLHLLAATGRTGAQHSSERRPRLFRLALTVAMAMSLPVAVGGALLAPRLIRLVYGETYGNASPLLAILLLAFPAIAFGYISVGLALASARTRLYAITAGAGGGVILSAYNVLVPPSAGGAGRGEPGGAGGGCGSWPSVGGGAWTARRSRRSGTGMAESRSEALWSRRPR